MLTLCRSKFDSRDCRDFSVLHNEKLIGGIYSGGPQGEKWWYALSGRASAPADSLEHAKMKLKAEWIALRTLEQVAERCVEFAHKCQNKKAERILRLLAVDLLLEANSKSSPLSNRKEHQRTDRRRHPSPRRVAR